MATSSRSIRYAAAVLAALLTASAVLTAGQAASRAPQSTGKGFIWKVERNGRTGWVVGSLHLATPDFFPLPASMETAFARADTLVEEIDVQEADSPEFVAVVLSKGLYPAGTTLESQLSKDTFTRVSNWFTAAGVGIAPFRQMKPWMVAITVQTLALQRLGFDPEHGIDKHFFDASKKAGKRFMALETAAEQIDFLDRLSPKTQDVMLRESVDSADSEQAEIKAIAAAWRAGDAAAVESIMLKGYDDAPEVYQTLLVDRNRRWMPKIEGCMESRSCFVVVGAAHLVGREGLVSLLKQRGYAVEQQ